MLSLVSLFPFFRKRRRACSPSRRNKKRRWVFNAFVLPGWLSLRRSSEDLTRSCRIQTVLGTDRGNKDVWLYSYNRTNENKENETECKTLKWQTKILESKCHVRTVLMKDLLDVKLPLLFIYGWLSILKHPFSSSLFRIPLRDSVLALRHIICCWEDFTFKM